MPPDPQDPQQPGGSQDPQDPFYSLGRLLASMPVARGRAKPGTLMPPQPQQSAQPPLSPAPGLPDPAHPMPEVEALGNFARSILTSPYTGAKRVFQGAARIGRELQPFEMPTQASQAQPPAQDPRQLAGGAADILGGTMEAGTMLLPEALASAPLKVGTGLAVGSAVGAGTHALGEKLGVAPEYTDLASHVAGLTTGIAAGHAIGQPGAPARLLDEAKRFYTDERGELQLPDLGTVPAVEEEAPGPGLYSRVDRVAESIPERGVHPNKLAGLLKSGASQEEVAYRQLPEFLASKGNQPVTRAELQAHLAANPAPFPETTVLGGPNPKHLQTLPEGYSLQLTHGHRSDGDVSFTLVNPTGEGRVLYADNRQDALEEALAHLQRSRGGPRTLPTKFQSYTLPGGETYREHLLTLPDPHAAQRTALQQQIEAKLAEIRDRPPADPPFASSEQYYASPQYARDQQIIAEHNALNDQLRALPPVPTGYTAGHFGGDYPNVLAHVRTTERTLPGAPGPPPPPYVEPPPGQLAGEGWTVRVDREDPFTGRRQMTALDPHGNFAGSRGMTALTPDEYLHELAVDRAKATSEAGVAAAAKPTGPRGRFLEEVQSDWHQAGKKQGYQQPLTPEQQARLAQLPAEIDSAGRMVAGHRALWDQASGAYEDRLRSATIARLPPEFAHLTSFSDALRRTDADVAAWRAAREAAVTQPELHQLRTAELQADQRHTAAQTRLSTLHDEQRAFATPKGVPNAPFKDAWPDLALKQQLVDVARDPHANWLGFTSGKTQAARYDLSKQISRLSFEPQEAGDYSLGSLVAHDHEGNEVLRENRLEPHELEQYVGKEPAAALQREIASKQYDLDQWSVAQDPETGYWHVVDPNGEYHGDDHAVTEQGAERALQRIRSGEYQRIRSGEYYSDVGRDHPEISGLDLQVGGEGMAHFYDNLLPKRLQKILKPFGGTVEQGHLSLPPERTSLGQASEPIWFARLTPEIKARIRREGLPLLTAMFGATLGGRALQSLRDAAVRDQVGTAPPVQAPER